MRTIVTFARTAMAALAFFCFTCNAGSQSTSGKWTAPASEAAKKNPIPASQNSVAAGQKIYSKRCLSCHGTSGNGDGPDAVDLGIHPAKLSQIITSESDGALFWKITNGKKPMPRFGGRLSESDRWTVINYIRTLAQK
jgi:mono/diheme cytochrome c family protein